jgi:ribonucleoside-diphosphate reductase alpha chain
MSSMQTNSLRDHVNDSSSVSNLSESSLAVLQNYKVVKRDGSLASFMIDKVVDCLQRTCSGTGVLASQDLILAEVVKNLFNQIKTYEVVDILILSSAALIEKDPAYSKVATRFLLQKIYKEVKGISTNEENLDNLYRQAFITGIYKGIEDKHFDARLRDFDLAYLSKSLVIDRDLEFEYLGLQTLYERYLIKLADGSREVCIETPQAFWMRVAMGLSIDEPNKNERAVEFYNLLSKLLFVSSTPTLLHSGLARPQLSSCFLSTVNDDLHHIFKCMGDNANMSKWSGGVATDWTNLRATGAMIKTIKIESQGLIPFLKVANDVTAAINRSGRRRSATVGYLEVWHLDYEDFMDLRRNTGDDRRRAHDMNFASWIPDLFMKRVLADGEWTMFSPEEVPELHHIYGREFENKYCEYEELNLTGKIALSKTMPARKLWRKMITRLFETGFPWMTFKDPSNIRSPQDHAGVVHSSNLCTEITLNTSDDETAVCNLGSVNLSRHILDGKLDKAQLEKTIATGMRMLDNVININFYPTIEGKNSNLRHRPVGMGMMGFQDALFKIDTAMDSAAALDFTDMITEKFSYHVINSSSLLAKERGTYESYKGSKWDRGLLPIDTIDLLEQERGEKIDMDRDCKMDWTPVRENIKKYGMRNSNTMAIAPTATISNIAGCIPCIEPIYSNIYVKSNMIGEFTVVNKYLVDDLKKIGLWSQDMLDKIKYFDGSIAQIAEIPEKLKHKYKGAFEIDPLWLLDLTVKRGKWIDQSISHNVFMRGVSGKKLDEIYTAAWKKGLKSTYYLRTLAASQIEKSTLDAKKFGYTQKREYQEVDNNEVSNIVSKTEVQKQSDLCALDESCDSCQ